LVINYQQGIIDYQTVDNMKNIQRIRVRMKVLWICNFIRRLCTWWIWM